MKNPLKFAKNKKFQRLAIVGAVLILVSAGIYAFVGKKFFTSKISREECLQTVKENEKVTDVTDAKTAKDIYNRLKSKSGSCANPDEDKTISQTAEEGSHVQLILYNAELAKSAYLSGNKEEAKSIAEKVQKMNQELSDEQRQKIPDRDGLFIDMYYISIGEYVYGESGQDE